jgi:AraC-like DNA-binding protein
MVVGDPINSYDTEPTIHAPSSENEAGFGMVATRSDVLSQVLTLIRLRGELVYSADLTAPWGISFPKGSAHFHFVEQGFLWVTTPGGTPLMVKQGDLVLLPHGTGHIVSDTPSTPALDIQSILPQHFDSDRFVLTFGNDGVACRVLGGFFHFEGGSLAAVMAALPVVVHIPGIDGKSPDWLDAIAHFLIKESREPQPGSSLMISRLIDLLVIRTLRTWAANRVDNGSWLGGLGEERIGRVLSAIHADPYRQWTVNSLAKIATMSRSLFAERFTATVGEAPLHYIKRWKLTLAADMLSTGGLKVTQAAQQTGYLSDAAFSRAFKTQFGYPPSEAKRA